MRSRRAGMWWGMAIEAPDPDSLAGFYADLLEWPVVHREPGTVVVATAEGGPYVVFQQAEGYVRPVWPPAGDHQRPMMHLDVQVDDLEEAAREAVDLGATVAEAQPNPLVRVMLDPAGHPFCLCVDDG